jgi:hypothetical protein
MSGNAMSNPNRIEHLFQSDIKKPYAGPEQRDQADRDNLPPELQTLLNILRREKGCRDNCLIPKDVQPYITHVTGTIKELGDGDFPKGVNNIRDQHKEVKALLRTKKDVISRVLVTIVLMLVTAMCTVFFTGLWDKVRG